MFQVHPDMLPNFFVSTLGKSARNFFRRTVKPGMIFEEIERFMLAEYNSNSRQIRVRPQLHNLRFDAFKAEKQLITDSVDEND